MKKNLAVRAGAIAMVLMVAFFSILPDLVNAEGDDSESQELTVAQEEAIGDELLPEEAETPNADAPEEAAPEENAPDVETPDMDSSEAPSEDGAPEPDTEIPSTEDPSESEAPEPDTEIPSTEAPSDEVTDGSKPGDGSSETPGTETPGEGEPPAEGPAAPEQGAEGPGTEQPVQEPSVEEPAPEESAEMDTVEDYLEILAKANADRKGREVKELKSGKLKAAEWEAFAAEEAPEDDFLWDETKTVIVGYQGNGGYIAIPGRCVAIGDGAFAGNPMIMGVAFPSQLSSIGASAFSGCVNLESVIIPDSVTSVGASAFANCTGLSALTIGAGTGTVSENEFYGCVSLQGLSVPEGISSIASGAFANCSNLSSISLPSTLTSLSLGAFAGDVNLASIEVSSASYSSYDGCIYSADGRQLLFCPQGKTGISFAPGMQSVGSGAFSGCRYLLSAVIPDVTDSIEADAFSGSAIKAVTIPVGVTAIGTQSGWTPSVVYGFKGSTAEAWANANRYIFESIDGTGSTENENLGDDEHIEDPDPGTETETETGTEKPGAGKRPTTTVTGGGTNPTNAAASGAAGGTAAAVSGNRSRLVNATPKTGVKDYGIFFLAGAIFLIGAASFAYSKKLRIGGK